LTFRRVEGGETLVWFASGIIEGEVGSRWTGKAAVKRHEADRRTGEPVTTITRAALVKG
jgi:hypothetical protein